MNRKNQEYPWASCCLFEADTLRGKNMFTVKNTLQSLVVHHNNYQKWQQQAEVAALTAKLANRI